MHNERLTYLFRRFVENNTSEEELQEFYRLVSEADEPLIRQLLDQYFQSKALSKNADQVDWDQMFHKIISTKPARAVSFNRTMRRIAAVAALVMVLTSVTYLLFHKQAANENAVSAAVEETSEPRVNDIAAPTHSKAMITLSDGRTIALDSLTTVTQNNVRLSRTEDGKIIYSGNSNAVAYNILSNPRGSGVIDILLSDGSHVWLNAGSTIRYPIAFTGSERSVEVTGEAYFEVTHNPSLPFKVVNGKTVITVLGTQFNVNAFRDKNDTRVTLLEGSVKVSNGTGEGLLKPHQQAVIKEEIRILNNVDTEQVMAWKNGLFKFHDTNIMEIMKEVERWYDVEVEYKGNFSDLNFGGFVSRQANVSALLERLEATGELKFEISGRKIIVTK